mgnify:FL=1
MSSNLNKLKFTNLYKWEIVLISLYQLGGVKSKVHTEEIAYKSFRIKSEEFSWTMKKFSKYPDLEPTRKALFKLRTEKKVIGAYATDLNKDGWILTETGVEECLKRREFLDIKKNKSNPQQFDKSKVISIKRSDYFKSFINKKNDLDKFDIYHVADFLKIRADNIPNLREVFFKTKTVSKIVDKNIYNFLEYVQTQNPKIFDEDQLMIDGKVKSKSKSRLI